MRAVQDFRTAATPTGSSGSSRRTSRAGWSENPSLVTGPNGGPFASNAYTFRTPPLTANAALESGVQFMNDPGGNAPRDSAGIWQVSRDNPVFPSRCGIDVALIIDLSGSLGSQLQQVKDAAKAMVNALEGTNSTIGVYTFATNAPASAGGANLPATSVSTTAGADVVRAKIDSFTTPTGSTNWDSGIGQVPRGVYDVGIVVTDGNPTVYGTGQGPGGYTTFRETENGIFSANRLKAPRPPSASRYTCHRAGCRCRCLRCARQPASDLGTEQNRDYFQAATFTGAAAVLRALALGNCVGSLTIVKQVVPAGNAPGVITGAQPAGGWNFTAASSTANVSIDAPATRATTLPGGAVNFPITYSQATPTGAITVTEDLAGQPGFAIFPVGGFNGTCSATSVGVPGSTPVPVTNTANGFTVNVQFNQSVSCEVYNQPPVPSTLTLEKQVINDGGGTATASEWTLSATNNGVSPINRPGTPVGGDPLLASTGSSTVTAGAVYTLMESSVQGYEAAGPWTCVDDAGASVPVTNSQVTVAIASDVTCRIVNNDIDATGTVTKTAGIPVQQENGTWTQQYTVTVANSSATAGFAYELNDAFLFGAGLTYTTVVVAGPGTINPAFDGNADHSMATGTVPAGAGNTHVYTVTVSGITVPAGAPGTPAVQCQPGEIPGAGGFLNRVQLFNPGGTTPIDTAYACAEPAFPTITKVAGVPTQNPDASWNVSYTVSVTNPTSEADGVAVQATLSDNLPAAPAGWTLVGGVWNVAAAGGAPAPTAPTYAPGSQSIWTGSIPANTTYSYTVAGVLMPSATSGPLGECPNGGITNSATVTSGLIVRDATACVTVNPPAVTLTKTVTDTNQLADGTWEITYDVVVTNSSASLASVYSLVDELVFGGDITVVGASWTGPTGGDFAADGTAVLAVDRVLEPAESRRTR